MESFLGELDEEKFEDFRFTPQNGFLYAQGDQRQSVGTGQGPGVAQVRIHAPLLFLLSHLPRGWTLRLPLGRELFFHWHR